MNDEMTKSNHQSDSHQQDVEWEMEETSFDPLDESQDIPQDSDGISTYVLFMRSRNARLFIFLFMIIIILILILAPQTDVLSIWDDDDDDEDETPYLMINFNEPVMLQRELMDPSGNQMYPNGVIGYEPSLAVDSTGAMFYTAHKDLFWQESWDYLASWWFISTDNGNTWRNPDDLGWNAPIVGGKYIWAGDEGDIAVDGQDNIYYVDTTLIDNNFHVFNERGDNYLYSRTQGSTLLDDRPWLTAQGTGVLHYLGNNGVAVTHPITGESGRVWYYKSNDGGVTWTLGTPMEGGWATIDAERYGNHVYVTQVFSDMGNQSIILYASEDQGESWSEQVAVGPMERNGVGEGMPTVFHGSNGRVFVIWQDSPNGGGSPATLYLARSEDYGRTFEYWNISHPQGAIYLYPTVNVCQYGEYHERNRLGISFYGTTDIPVSEDSEWYLYAAVAEDPKNGTQFDYQIADPQVLYTGNDLHALHDFFEIVIAPDGNLHIAYQINVGQHPYESGEEQRYLMSVKGDIIEESR